MPENTTALKIRAVRELGIEPVFCGPSAEARRAAAAQALANTGGTLIHPYDDTLVIAGQGTVAVELTRQLNPMDVLYVPVGGGGLLAGTLIVIKSLWPSTRVIAAEPAWADDAFRSLKCGAIQAPLRYDTVADGLRTPLGQINFPIIRELVDDIVLVEESEIVHSTRILMEMAKLVVEPSGAVPLAALLRQPERVGGKRVGAILSGGNLDLDCLPW
jgi:threonine dehydratase